jgi:hypothetical protein
VFKVYICQCLNRDDREVNPYHMSRESGRLRAEGVDITHSFQMC